VIVLMPETLAQGAGRVNLRVPTQAPVGSVLGRGEDTYRAAHQERNDNQLGMD
jgi:hypothetical protein